MVIRNNKILLALIMVMFFGLLSTTITARENKNQPAQISFLKATAGNKVTQSMSNIGNWGFWANYDGQTGHDPFTGGSGGYYPRGTAAAIYMDGIIWGGFLDGVYTQANLRVGGIGYRIGTQPGWIDNSGQPVDPSGDMVSLYRIRQDYASLSNALVKQDAAELNNVGIGAVTDQMTADIINQYAEDWKNWPVSLGAPYVDVDGDGTYNPVLEDGYPTLDGDYPGLANADQVIWYVVNDLNETKTVAHSGVDPIGLELQVTLWAYNQPGGGLGQIVFKKYKLINKSTSTIDSMFLAQYSDPDLGTASDDLVGCDVDLSLHYVYNGSVNDTEYDNFNLAPPAAGYDFFQGPIIYTGNSADTAVFDLKYIQGAVNLPMTSFGYFAAGAAISDPPMGEIDFTLQWYNMLNGYTPTNSLTNPTAYVAGSGPNAGQATKFPLDGDPVGDPDGLTTDVDGKGDNLAPGDRRMFAATGPFQMKPNDVQELVVAIVAGIGSDNITSISAMKNTDVVAQKLYDGLFSGVPKAPVAPNVKWAEVETEIILNWGYDHEGVAKTESKDPITGYDFEGYVVYQSPTPNFDSKTAVRIATFDLANGITTIYGNRFLPQYGQNVNVPVQFGTDYGVKRNFTVTKNYITGEPLRQGTEYYFAVTAYNYNATPVLIEDMTLESGQLIMAITHQGTKPGNSWGTTTGEGINGVHEEGNSDGRVEIEVIDPTETKSPNYTVNFVVDNDTNSATYGETVWNLLDADDVVILKNQVQLAPADNGAAAPIIHGLKVKVYGPPTGINPYRYGEAYGKDSPTSKTYLTGWDWSEGDRWIGGRAKGWIGLFGGLGNGEDWLGTSLDNPLDYMDVDILFAGDTLDSAPDTTVEAVMVQSKAQYPERWSKAISYDGWNNWAPRMADIPMAAYDVESDPPRRLKILFIEDGLGNLIWDMGWNPVDSVFADDGGYEYVLILSEDYDTDYTEYLADADLFSRMHPVLYTISPQGRGTRPYLQNTFRMNVFASNVNTPADVFTYEVGTNSYSDEVAKADVEKINVFPNPYYAYNSNETDRFSRFVTFNHLPPKVTIRIFDLAGVQVAKIEKDDESLQFQRWDLLNDADLPVASGLYIAYIDMPDLGKTKILKFFVIQREQMLQFY